MTDNRDRVLQLRRSRMRNLRHPGWRQLYYDQNGMCQVEKDNDICGSNDGLEFHHEEKDYDYIILACFSCHSSAHNQNPTNTRYKSLLAEDVDAEITSCRSLKSWMKKYGIVEKSDTP